MVKFILKIVLISLLIILASGCVFFSIDYSQDPNTANIFVEKQKISQKISSVLDTLQVDLSFSSYFGGNLSESNTHILTDRNGDVWITGYTTSANFPTTSDAYNKTYGGSGEIFISKISGSNGNLLYSSYLGGSAYEIPHTINIDVEGNIWITGETGSANFPMAGNSYNNKLNGTVDAFIAKISGLNGSLLYSSFLGGSGAELIYTIAFDTSGDVWFTGITDSTDFPISLNALFPDNNGSFDAFLTKLSKNGSSLLYSTYIGGTGADYGYSILIDPQGDIWLAGATYSPNFPRSLDAYDSTYNSNADIFLSKIAHNGSTLLYSTYLGGSGSETALALDFDSDGNIWGTGSSSSPNFPPTPNSFNSSYSGSTDCIVFEFNTTNPDLLYTTYLGGSNQDSGNDIMIDNHNSVWVTGYTSSDLFPTTENAFNKTTNGVRDVFLLSLAHNGTELFYSSYFGGNDLDNFPAFTFQPSGKIWIIGETQSSVFPTTDDAYNKSLSGTRDLFISAFTLFTAPDPIQTLSVTEGFEQKAILTWEQPLYQGNSPIQKYNIFKNTSQVFDMKINETTYEYFFDLSLQIGTTYYYTITAVNLFGESSFSDVIEITITDPFVTVETTITEPASTITVTNEISITTIINQTITIKTSSIVLNFETETITQTVTGFSILILAFPLLIASRRKKSK